MEGRVEMVSGGTWDQPAKWREGVLIFRAGYHAAAERQSKRAGKGG